MKPWIGLAVAATLLPPLLVFASAGTAAQFDGSKPLLCASVEIKSCVPGTGCRAETVETINGPQFLDIDFDQKQITGARALANPVSTRIEQIRRDEENIVLNGVDGRLAWNLAIATETGKMMLTAIRTAEAEPIAIVIFGACTMR
jgi:hypothetical protein